MLRDVFELLGSGALKNELAALNTALRQPGIKFGVKKAYSKTFDRLREVLTQVQGLNVEIHSMLGGTFLQLNTEFGFSLHLAKTFDLSAHLRDLDSVERGHVQYLAVGNAIRLAQPEFADRLVRALATRVRSIFEAVQTEVESWNKAAMAQLDVQLRERRRNFERRIEAIERIQHAAGGLDERIGEIHTQEDAMVQLDFRLTELVAHFTGEIPQYSVQETTDPVAA
jgi:hypothetical protein